MVFANTAKDTLQVDTNTVLVKADFRENFKEHYDSDKFIYEYTAEAQTLSWWQKFKMWLVEKLISFFSTSKEANHFVSVLFKVLYIVVILFVIYFIAKTIVNKEGNWIFGRRSDHLNINTSEVEKELMETDFDTLIASAVRDKNYRLAVRYYYLKTLKLLAKKELIIWEYEKTNQDYYYELKQKDIKEKFSYISYIYNYSWYGEYGIDASDYQEAVSSFNALFKAID